MLYKFSLTVAAFHLKWDESILEKNIANWSVNIIQLSRNKRHLDRAKLMNFWEILDK
jgi:parafibromin